MGLLTKEAILAANDLTFEDVPVPEWGGTVRIVTLRSVDRDHWDINYPDARKAGRVRASLFAKCVVDDVGARVFGDADVEMLNGKSGAVLDRLFDVAVRLNGLRKTEADAKSDG
jgi:hypothetical protein